MSWAFTSAAAKAETFAAGLSGHGVAGPAVAAVDRAWELTAQASAAWTETSGALDRQSTVMEAYLAAPESGGKDFLTDSGTRPAASAGQVGAVQGVADLPLARGALTGRAAGVR